MAPGPGEAGSVGGETLQALKATDKQAAVIADSKPFVASPDTTTELGAAGSSRGVIERGNSQGREVSDLLGGYEFEQQAAADAAAAAEEERKKAQSSSLGGYYDAGGTAGDGTGGGASGDGTSSSGESGW